MLSKCPECQKEVSSEAEKCIHCGFPIKKSPPKETVVVAVSQNTSSKRGPGGFFIFLGIVGIIGGIIAFKPSGIEALKKRLTELTQEDYQNRKAFEGAGLGNYNSGSKAYDYQMANSDYSSAQSKRHIKAACWFVPGGILFITGLIMRAGSPKSQEQEMTKTT